MLTQRQSTAVYIAGAAALATAGILVFLRKHKANDKLLKPDTRQKTYSEREITLKDGRRATLTIREIEKLESPGFHAMLDYARKLEIANDSWIAEGKVPIADIIERFRVFPKGQIGAYLTIDGSEELIGMITSVRMRINGRRDIPDKYQTLLDRFLWLNRLEGLLDNIDNERFTSLVVSITNDLRTMTLGEDAVADRRMRSKLREAISMTRTLHASSNAIRQAISSLEIGLEFCTGNTIICPRVDVLEEYQSYGIARALVKAQKKLADNLGCKTKAYSRMKNFKAFNEMLASLQLKPAYTDRSLGPVVLSVDEYLGVKRPKETGTYDALLQNYGEVLIHPNYFENIYELYRFYMGNNRHAYYENFRAVYEEILTEDILIRQMLSRQITRQDFEYLSALFDYINFRLRKANPDYGEWRMIEPIIGMHVGNGGRISGHMEGSTPNLASGGKNIIIDY